MARSHRCPWSRNNSLNLPFSHFKGPLLLFEFLLLSIHTHTHTHAHVNTYIHFILHTHTTHTHTQFGAQIAPGPTTFFHAHLIPNTDFVFSWPRPLSCSPPYSSLHLFIFYTSFWSPRHLPHCLPPVPPPLPFFSFGGLITLVHCSIPV